MTDTHPPQPSIADSTADIPNRDRLERGIDIMVEHINLAGLDTAAASRFLGLHEKLGTAKLLDFLVTLEEHPEQIPPQQKKLITASLRHIDAKASAQVSRRDFLSGGTLAVATAVGLGGVVVSNHTRQEAGQQPLGREAGTGAVRSAVSAAKDVATFGIAAGLTALTLATLEHGEAKESQKRDVAVAAESLLEHIDSRLSRYVEPATGQAL